MTTAAPRPTPAPVRTAEIPEALRSLPQWVVWRYVEDGEGDWDKPPVNANTGGPASSTNGQTWAFWDRARSVYEAGGYDGLGFVLACGADEEEYLVGVDLDHCRNTATGELDDWARDVVRRLDSYSEASPSGEGVRVFVRGKLPPDGRKKGDFEVYCRGRYVTVTGNRLPESSEEIAHRADELLAVHALFWPPAASRPEPPPAQARPPLDMNDEELVARIIGSKSGDKFRRLWGGSTEGYLSASEADMALASILAFWCGPYPERIDALFRSSGLFRSKWNRADYRDRTIRKAVEGCKDFYTPGTPIATIVMNGRHQAPQPSDPSERIIRRGSEIVTRPVEWLWPGRIPLSKLTTFAGQTGQGKTFVTCDIMARVTRGGLWPDGKPSSGLCGQVMLITGDDDIDDTLAPRLIHAGADMDRVLFFTEKAQAEWTMAALKTLDTALAQAGSDVRLVAIDPPTSFMAGVDDHKNAELRAILTPFKDWARRQSVAVILITHVNKNGANVDALMRVMGSVAWVTGTRTAYMFTADPDDRDRQLFCTLKNNLGRKAKTLAYRVTGPEDAGYVEWLGEVETTADEAVGAGKSKTRKVVAAEWLVEQFRAKLEWSSDELMKAAGENGISRSAMFEAKAILCLPSCRQTVQPDGTRVWIWWVPADWPRLNRETVQDDDSESG